MNLHHRLFKFSHLILVASIGGCASPKSRLVLEPVGPPPYAQEVPGNKGSLIVYSALEATFDSDAIQYRDRHTPYRVMSADGMRLLKVIPNDDGRLLGSPERVELPIGKYRILARANGYGDVAVPILIKAHQTTVLHLEGGFWWPMGSAIRESDPVRLPRGEIVGWRTREEANP